MTFRILVVCAFLGCAASLSVGVEAASAGQQAAGGSAISGVVRDSSGAVVAGALVIARAGTRDAQTVTGPDGRFSVIAAEGGDITLIVRAGGFAEAQQRVAGTAEVAVILMPAALLEEITVTPTRTEQAVGTIPASVSVLSSEEIRQSPAVVADDVLRQAPTFSLFRRNNSLAAHPTTQGVSLRGIGPSGVSRTLVLLDGVPFNDPFGGWVYWTRVPLEAADRIEIVDSPTSNLYGNYAMGGVINIVTSRPMRRTLAFKPQYGNLGSPKFDLFGSDVWGKVGAAVEASFFRTDGYANVAPSERGLVDNNVNANFSNVNVKLDYNATSQVNAFFKAGYFKESRDNGKVSTFDATEEANNTRWSFVSGGARVVLPDQSALQARMIGDFETFHSNFLAVPAATPPRSIGRVTLNQRVPTTGVGSAVEWSKSLAGRQFLSAGIDWRWVDGESQEDALDATRGATVVTRRLSGGSQQSTGVFVQDLIAPIDRLQVTLSARVDHWRNYNAHNLETTVATGLPTANNRPSLPDRDDTVVSPRAAAMYHITDRVSVWGDYGLGFRAPTLNELYRQFSVGAVLTRPNDQLGPERLKGGEIGVNVAPTRNLAVRTTWFDDRIQHPVSNVTIGTNLLQRQNLGSTRVWGIQTDVDYRISQAWKVSGGYFFNQAKVVEFAAVPALVNNCQGVPGEACFLPQVPENRGSVRIVYSDAKYATVALGIQSVGRQFEDDQNIRVVPAAALADAGYPASTEPGLPKFTLVDLLISRVVTRNVDAYFGVQNLFDRQYFAFTQATTLGSPRLVNAGLRIRIAGK